MSDLDTTLEADPAGLRAIAAWLRAGSGDSIAYAASTLGSAREDSGDWTGDSATAFRGRMGSVLATTDSARSSIDEAAGGLERFADAVAGLQLRVASLRETATGRGLGLTTTTVLRPAEPGPTPTRPGDDATPADTRAYQQASTAHAAAVSRQAAFQQASTEMASVRADLTAAELDLERVGAAVQTLLVPALDFLTGAGIQAVTDQATAAMRGHAAMLRNQAASALAEAARPGAGRFPASFYDDVDFARGSGAQAAALTDDAARLARAGKAAGAVVGGVLTGVSIYTDIQAGESVGQAAVSNVVGWGASVAAGAAIGTAIGTVIPGAGNVVGLVVGGVVGGAVGIFTSGAIDGLWENNWDVGAAFENGVRDLADTGKAVVDLAEQGAAAVGDAVSAVGDGLSDAWDSIFG
ncbi:hypothetical protein [Cellulosimicrobium cellulans]|uniref:hypothetical protein n=1 Tax=Cellulosimicrobium cellulans TaxID=1710 RepID=UPI00130E2083|nr:hypothetical protein [Cellulosimicrobium cellulans]